VFSRLTVLGLLGLLVTASPRATAQKADDPTDYRRLLTPPSTTAEFWEAIKFEMDVGRFDLAAGQLRTMLAKKPTPESLIKISEKDGLASVLKLRLVPRWYEDRAKDKQARADVEAFIEAVTSAVRTKLTDPKRIRLFVDNLYKSPEENAFARIELARSGTAAIPYIVEELQRRPENNRGPIVEALSRLGPDTVPPLLAALESSDPGLRENVVDVLLKRKDLYLLKNKGIDVAPSVWPLASSLDKSPTVRRKARELLAVVYGLRSPDLLPLPLLEMTREAGRYYHHQARLVGTRKLTLWQWDDKKRLLTESAPLEVARAEEILGLRYARHALALDPGYRPAQVVMLSLLIDSGYQGASADRPLGTLRPTVEDLVLKMNPSLLVATLDQALKDGRTPVVLATVQAIGKLADVQALRPMTQGEPALVRALAYGDWRVQLAAADALLRIPGSVSGQAASRVVNILKGALAPVATAGTRPRVLLALTNESYSRDAERAVSEAGFDVALASTGRQVMRRLQARADIDAVVIDSTLPQPGLDNLIAQLRADANVKRLPVLVASFPDSRRAEGILTEMTELRLRIQGLDGEIRKRIEADELDEKLRTYKPVMNKPDLALRELQGRRAKRNDQLQYLTGLYERESSAREAQLRRHLARQKSVRVVAASVLLDPGQVTVALEDQIRDSATPPVTRAEHKAFTETALAWLAKLATGQIKGYDIRPAEAAVAEVLRGQGHSETAQVNAAKVLGHIPGPAAQRQLIVVALDEARPAKVRVEAIDELIRHMQEYGPPDDLQERTLRGGVLATLKKAGLDPALRDRMTRLVGVLRPTPRTTGQRLREFGK
jgi:DNA-binding response OmpR family regulator